jgi:U3 small nucleolar RNA-associated protein 15
MIIFCPRIHAIAHPFTQFSSTDDVPFTLMQVFDAGSRSVLRQLKGHSRPVHVTRFASDKTHVLSGGDDVTLRWWDIASGKQLLRLVGHEDYVRAAAASSSSSDTWASGGYDHTVKLWDVRAGPQCAMSLDHGAPVEDVAFFPSGGLMVSAGGTSLCVWDLLR